MEAVEYGEALSSRRSADGPRDACNDGAQATKEIRERFEDIQVIAQFQRGRADRRALQAEL